MKKRLFTLALVIFILTGLIIVSANAYDEPATRDIATIDLSIGRVVITDDGYTQYDGIGTTVVNTVQHTGSYVLTGTLNLSQTGLTSSAAKRTAVSISSESDKTFDITLENATIVLTHHYYSTSNAYQVHDGLFQAESGSVRLSIEGVNSLTANTTSGSKTPSRPSFAAGAPIIRVKEGDLTLTGSGTLKLDNQDEIDRHDFSAGIQIHRGSMTVDMTGTLEIHVGLSTVDHIVCGEEDQPRWDLPGMDADDTTQGNLLIRSGNVILGGGTAAEGNLEKGAGINAGRSLEITGGTIRVASDHATVGAAAHQSIGDFGSVVIRGDGTSVSVENNYTSQLKTVYAKENMTIDGGAYLSVVAAGSNAHGIVVGETQAAAPYFTIGRSAINVAATSSCIETYCDLTVNNGAKLELVGNYGIYCRVDYNRNNAYPAYFENAVVDVHAANSGILYGISNTGSKLEFGDGADITVSSLYEGQAARRGVYSAADMTIGGNSQIKIDGSFSIYGMGTENQVGLTIEDDAFVKVLNRHATADGISAGGEVAINCEELIASSQNTGTGRGAAASGIVITDMNYVPLNKDTYYDSTCMGERNLLYDAAGNDTTALMTGATSSPYLHVKRNSVTVAIVPADITVYVGGSGYVGAVDGDGAPLGEDNGFPVPGFTISAEGLDNFDPAQAVLKYQNGGNSFTWIIVPYDDVDGASHGIYRFDPQPGSNTHVKMRFFDEDLNTYVDSDSFDIAGHLGKDFKMEVYGENILMEHVKLVYGGVEYAVTTENGTLKVRSTTDSPEYGEVVAQEASVPNGESGVVAPEDTTYYINDSTVKVSDDAGVMLLFDDIIEQNSASVSNTQLLINRADEVLGGSSDSRRYEAKYLDLVDTSNGNAWVAADGAVTVYWPLPAGTGWNTNFTLLRFDGLNRETSVGNVENLIATCNVTPIRVENTGTHIKFTVEKAGFAPFILVWDEYNTPITPIPEPDNSPVGLNTEDHVAYIIGYEDGTVRPGANITRAEVATIFFRLLTDETRESYWSQSSGFTDVASGAWYNNAVSTLTRAGILDGYEDGSFRPNASITRAEFTKIAVSFFKHAGGASANPFNDVPDSAWYAEFVKAAAELGLIDGYEDGTFRPNAPITRAEACTIVNRTLGRAPDKDNLLPEHEMLTWPDNSRDAWYYAQIQEATNSHDYQWLGAIELWTAKLAERDWDALEKEWSNAYSAPGGEVAR